MRPLKFSCLNYCQHRGEHSWDFTGSVIGIVGANGNGKSNLLRGLKSSITGDFDRPRQRTITFGEETGHLEFTFEVHPGLTATVRRELHREKTTLSFTGEDRPKITGVRQVNAAILELLATDKTILSEIVFVAQEELASLIFSAPTENARLAGKFFGLERATVIEKALSEKIAQVQILPLPGDPDVLGREVVELRARLAELADIESTLAAVPDPEESTAILGQIEAFNASRDAMMAIERYRMRRSETEERLVGLQAEATTVEESLGKIPVEKLRAFYLRETDRRRAHQARQGVVARRQKIQVDLAVAEQDVDRAKTLATPEQLAGWQAELRALEQLEAGNETIRREQDQLLDKTREVDGTPCPVCLKPLNWTEEEIQPILDDQAQPKSNARTAQDIQSLRHAIGVVESERASRAQKVTSLHDALDRLDEELSGLGEDQGDGDPEKWDRGIRQYEEMRERLSRLVQEAQTLEKSMATTVAPPEPVGVPVDFDVAAAQRRLETINELRRERQEITHQREILAGQITARERDLAAAAGVQQKNAAAARHLETLRRLRGTFHPDGAPAELVGRRVARMVPRINEYLAALNCRFRARATTGFNFEYEFLDSPDFPRLAVELSGGERTATSVAFRLAALSSFGASVGLLILDEASQALDAEKIELFGALLENLKSLAKQLGLTLLFVTHEESLAISFDQVIEL